MRARGGFDIDSAFLNVIFGSRVEPAVRKIDLHKRYTMPAQTVWGIDIGESAIKAVKMARVRDYLEIIRVDMIPIGPPGGAEESTVDRETLLIAALEEFVRRHDPSDSRVIASIQGRNTFCKLITLPPVEPKRIPEIVRFEVKQQIPFRIEDIVWDYVQCKKDYAPGEEIEVNLVAIRKEIVENFVETFAQAGIRLDGLQATPLALYNLVKYELAPEGNVVVIDVGARLTDLVIVEGERFWPRTLGIAGKHITKALEDKFEIPPAEAESLKLSAADSKHYQKIFGVVRPVLKDLVTEIHRTIGYYKSLSKDVTFDKVIFLGNGTKLAGFEKFFGENLPYRIEVVQGLKNIRVSRRLNLKALKGYLPGFGVAIGLAIHGLREGRLRVNLLPDEISGKMRPGKIIAMAAALLFILLALPTGLVTSNVGVAASERLAGIYSGDKNKDKPAARDVMDKHNTASSQMAQMQKVQDEARSKYLKPYETLELPIHVLKALDRLTPRGNLKEVPTPGGKNLIIKRDETDKIYLISVEYQNILRVKEEPRPKPGKRLPPPRFVREVKVVVTGLVRVKGDLRQTSGYIQNAFLSGLNEHRLSATRMQIMSEAAYGGQMDDLFNKWNGGILKKILKKKADRDEFEAGLSLYYLRQPSFKEKMRYKNPKDPDADPYGYYDALVKEIEAEARQPAQWGERWQTDDFWDDGEPKPTDDAGRFFVFKVTWYINPEAAFPEA